MSRFFVLLLCVFSFHAQATSNEVELHRYTSLDGWNVNSFWIETRASLILIDAQLLKSDAKLLASSLKAAGKPLKAAFITHPHPDHISGLAHLREQFGHFEIITTNKSAEQFKPAFEQFSKGPFAKKYGGKVETQLVAANRIAKNGEKFNFDGLEVITHDLGAGESHNHMGIEVPQLKWLFTGDATMHNAHYYVGEGRSTEALALFDRLQKEFSNYRFFSGHGDPASSKIIDSHREYVTTLRSLVKKATSVSSNLIADKKLLKPDVRQALAQKIDQLYPHFNDYGIDPLQLIGWNIMGIERELLVKTKSDEARSGS